MADQQASGVSSRALPLDREAADRMWADYLAAYPAAAGAAPDYTVEHFGDSAELADELLALVLSGKKRATAELADEFTLAGDPLPRIGGHWIACSGDGAPRVIVRSTELRIGPFSLADEAFARDEAEGDGSFDYWERGHRRYWTRTCAARGAVWSEDDEIVFERFTIVWPPEHADA